MRDHLETLADRAPDSVASYVAMARRTTERALAAGRLKRHEGAPLLDLLDGTPRETPSGDGRAHRCHRRGDRGRPPQGAGGPARVRRAGPHDGRPARGPPDAGPGGP
ncbi:hypothetical protein U6N30_01640 [Blastococcus brunescens]|uniref:Core-binding (CB) domain-containing protein n=1 Tax=Blastococcus brunescens TaxID=1564165 RepID=A0ABZ1B159_9ACTN|nr:hypothetical protein [Blastococcus sp. BMG 8361]WRL64542.1 hypothetical protein U6N30_01640 [Blastococcus sp. BMG 8361]